VHSPGATVPADGVPIRHQGHRESGVPAVLGRTSRVTVGFTWPRRVTTRAMPETGRSRPSAARIFACGGPGASRARQSCRASTGSRSWTDVATADGRRGHDRRRTGHVGIPLDLGQTGHRSRDVVPHAGLDQDRLSGMRSHCLDCFLRHRGVHTLQVTFNAPGNLVTFPAPSVTITSHVPAGRFAPITNEPCTVLELDVTPVAST
jgi:hypothetical protein